jgi:hypothetical protein
VHHVQVTPQNNNRKQRRENVGPKREGPRLTFYRAGAFLSLLASGSSSATLKGSLRVSG